MTLRPEEIERLSTGGDSGHAWHLQVKGVQGQGIYGSVITDREGNGLYLLAEGDFVGTPGCEQRMTCLMSPSECHVVADAAPLAAREAITTALLALGWGPRVSDERELGRRHV